MVCYDLDSDRARGGHDGSDVPDAAHCGIVCLANGEAGN